VDFSDRVNGKRKSYKASTRRQQKREDGTEVLGDISDEEDGESLERKLARLRREIEEVKEEFGRRAHEKQKANGVLDHTDDVRGGDEAVNLSKMLDSISVSHGNTIGSAGVRLAKSLGPSIKSTEPPPTVQTLQKGEEATTYTVTYAPDYQQSHTFARVADFDSRLMLLEKALGITSTAIPAFDSKGAPMAVLPTLDRLQRQMTVITEASPSSLDSISRRVRTLTQEAERLEEARKSAKVAQEELRAANGETPTKIGDGENGGDSEQVAKINALYGTLGTIENLAPILPSLLDRLRSLRAIHSDAATASETLDRVAKRQEDMAADIKKWREGLERVEQAMNQSETVMGGNMKVVEGWVKDLEERMARF
jgi:nuclear migration protein JNM1